MKFNWLFLLGLIACKQDDSLNKKADFDVKLLESISLMKNDQELNIIGELAKDAPLGRLKKHLEIKRQSNRFSLSEYKLNPMERQLCLEKFRECTQAFKIAVEARRLGAQLYPGAGQSEKGEAFQQAYWIGKTAHVVGKKFARQIGDAHELGDESFAANQLSDVLRRQMSFHNNAKGVEVASGDKQDYQALVDGGVLLIVQDNQLVSSDTEN